MKFSQRQGFTPTEKPIQLDFIDEDLINSLWNILKTSVFDNLKVQSDFPFETNTFKPFTYAIWHNFYKLPVDRIPSTNDKYETIKYIREWFYKADWFEVYDFIEYCLDLVTKNEYYIQTNEIETQFNTVLEREFSGYRFIYGNISPITNEEEIGEIQLAIENTNTFTANSGCNIHLHAALEKLSDKRNPDYRNSIKESISAIESLAKIISNNAKDSLGASLDKIKAKIKIHSALEKGFKQIYGYTSDSSGIRHSITDADTCEFEDAKFMLVSCSAFINYLIAKAVKADIKL